MSWRTTNKRYRTSSTEPTYIRASDTEGGGHSQLPSPPLFYVAKGKKKGFQSRNY